METTQPELGVRRWMAEYIAGQNICPPLASIVNRSGGNRVEWQEVLPIISLHHLPATSPALIQQTGDLYQQFIHDTFTGIQDKSALTIILPDFKNNKAYDDFMGMMGAYWLEQSLTQLNERTVLDWVAKMQRSNRIVQGSLGYIVDSVLTGNYREFLWDGLYNAVFRPIYFYGQHITKDEAQKMRSERGHWSRQRILSRAVKYPVCQDDFLRTTV